MIKNSILLSLYRCDGNPIRSRILLADVRASGLRCSESEFDDALVDLKNDGWADNKTIQSFTKERLWKITPKGISYITGGK